MGVCVKAGGGGGGARESPAPLEGSHGRPVRADK